ncbi:MAG: hypothetical protein M3373_07475 [Gemmatimonadota bacterium]|nr:hypothetical protein [Gemmatimonadota bacterium]
MMCGSESSALHRDAERKQRDGHRVEPARIHQNADREEESDHPNGYADGAQLPPGERREGYHQTGGEEDDQVRHRRHPRDVQPGVRVLPQH